MKRLIVLFFLIAGVCFAQNTDQGNGSLTQQEIVNKVFQKTQQLLRVGVVPSPNLKTVTGVSVAGVDSLVFGFTSQSITIINDSPASDTMFISNASTFPAGSTIKRYSEEGGTFRLAWTKLYFKFGTIPASGKLLRIEVQ